MSYLSKNRGFSVLVISLFLSVFLLMLSVAFADRAPAFPSIFNKVDIEPTMERNEYEALVKSVKNDTSLVNEKSKNGTTPLHAAVFQGSKKDALFFIEKGAFVNAKDMQGNTPLYYASLKGDADMVSLLLEKGASPNIANNKKELPLHVAARKGYFDVVKMLVDAGSKVDARDYKNATPFFWAVCFCCYFPDKSRSLKEVFEEYKKIWDFLLEKGADINSMNIAGNALIGAVFRDDFQYEATKYMLEHGADPNAEYIEAEEYKKANYKSNSKPMDEGYTPLFVADNERIINLLLEYGADINYRNNKGNTPIFWFAQIFNPAKINLIKVIIEKGADINAINNEGKTPLLLAVSDGNFYIAKILLEHGADIKVKDKSGKTAMDYALEKGDKEMVNLLKKYEKNVK